VPPTSNAIATATSAGDVDEWIAVGSHNLQLNADHGAVVGPATPERAPRLSPRALEDGTAFLRAAGQPLADVEQVLFEAFYATDVPYKPAPAELRGLLADCRALVVVHDLGSERIAAMRDLAPGCRFVLASREICPPSEGRPQPLDDPKGRVLQALELLAPAAVHVEDLAAIAAVSDADAVLERLRQMGAAQAHGPRWSATLAGPREPPPPHAADVLLQRARDQLRSGVAERPAEDVPAILAALHAGGAAQRWHDVLALARAADPLLMLSARWGAWDCALERARTAALVTGDRAASAWALHQLGTRAGCLGDVEAAIPELEEALALRRELGDEAGADVTAGNLAVLHMQEFQPCPSSSQAP
jgi:hypothetical protein